MEVEFICGECRKASNMESESFSEEVVCPHCKKSFGALSQFTNESTGVQHCGVCGCRDLFIQKDFNRKIGVGIAILGAVLAPFTRLISLLVCALIDLALYLGLPVITICYRCHAIYRDFEKNPAHEGFNLGINDRYRAADR